MNFRLHFNVHDCGDGSVSVEFHKTERDARKTEEGWGESSYNSLELKVENGKIFRKDLVWTGANYEYLWLPLEMETGTKPMTRQEVFGLAHEARFKDWLCQRLDLTEVEIEAMQQAHDSSGTEDFKRVFVQKINSFPCFKNVKQHQA